MNDLVKRAVKITAHDGILPKLPQDFQLPIPAINKVELYLSFHGNDCCAHCITNSGPHREETLSPDNARTVLRNIAQNSIVTRLYDVIGGGTFNSDIPQQMVQFDALEHPPDRLTDPLCAQYADCLMGKGGISHWMIDNRAITLPFSRPSLRLSGGEFSMWPHKIAGKSVPSENRLHLQTGLLSSIRSILPEYDVYILTNGRFAVDMVSTEKVIGAWATAKSDAGNGRIRICISVDNFHRPPPGSTIEQMLERIWTSCRKTGLGAPYLYGVSNQRIGLLGRALRTFGCSSKHQKPISNVSGSTFVSSKYTKLDPVDLACTDGCDELKGFICKTPMGMIPVNNIVVAPSGHLAYCCACVGDYGNFVREPRTCLKNIVVDPISIMLRQQSTATHLLNLAVELDPTITVVQSGPNAAITGSTCYQLLSGMRVGA